MIDLQSITGIFDQYQWEIFITEKELLKSYSQDFHLESVKRSKEIGISVRIKKEEKTGFAYSSDPTEKTLRKTFEKATQMLKISDNDPFITFSRKSQIDIIEMYDTFAAERLSAEEKLNQPVYLEEKIRKADRRIKKIRECSFTEEIVRYRIINSNGVDLSEKGTYYTLTASVVAQNNNDSQIAWGFSQARFLRDLNLDVFAQEVVNDAVSLLGAKQIPTTTGRILFTPYSFSQILEAFFPVFSGETFIKGRSILEGKEGEKIAPEFFVLIDDGRLKNGVGTRSFDDEGTKTKKNYIIKNGIFEGFLHSIYTGNAAGKKSSGNGFRSSFKEPPSVRASNFCLESVGNLKTSGKIYKILQILGLHTANPVTGDFSVGISGVVIEDAHPVGAFTGVTLTGNFFDMLKKISGIGDDLKFYGRFGSPSVLVEDMVIGGC